ncbi:MAG: TRAP transporter large permease subunit [Rhodospirillaceae bacterium]|nr:TRAP transporter large permease subunit [Rhodospirillaceae bacterium]MDE0619100.1 TRAP transporter large permease subunit [Rhodospirillaceae bacterium]
MSPLLLGLLGLALILLLIALRIPIGLALGVVSFGGLVSLIGFDAALALVGRTPFEFSAQWTFTAIPMFLLMGTIAYRSGMTEALYRAARLWLAFLPGGLAVATNFACAGFGAASGSTLATTVAMGRMAIPEMLRYRYDPGLACGVCACAGTLGSIIPPSILMVLYGIFAEQSISKLFVAGIFPGLLTAAIYAAMIIGRCKLNPSLAPSVQETITLAEKLDALKEVWPLPVLILGVMGGIYGGLTTPTEAGALGAALAFLIALFQKRMSIKVLNDSVTDAILSTATIFFVALGAIVLTQFMTFSGVPGAIADVVGSWAVSPLLLVIAASVIYLILGMFLDPLGILLLTIPVLLPLFSAFNLDLIWLGILAIKYIEIGLMTPPIGLNVFVVKSLVGDRVGMGVIFKGVMWFLAAEAVIMVLLIAFPEISLFLPGLMD